MAIVVFTKNAAGPNFGPYSVGDVVDLGSGEITKLTAVGVNSVAQASNERIANEQLTSRVKKRGDSLA